ncbi:hypothetical protein ACV3RH_02310 [Clostridium perfringens]|nr:hypothetical protein [Clostridium perfringens]
MFKNICDFDKFDNIIITDDNIKKIREKLNVNEYIPFMGIFNECVILFKEGISRQYVYYNQINENIVHIESYNYEKGKLIFICSFDLDFRINGSTLSDRITNIRKGFSIIKLPKHQIEYYINYVSCRYAGIVGYFYLIQKNKKIITLETIARSQSGNNKNIQSKAKMTQYRSIIKFEDIEITINTKNQNSLDIFKKKYNKHTNSWGVRGHYRTLKSGKKIFIKAYTKGDKNKYKPKDYEIS